jgi:hypothetical protein
VYAILSSKSREELEGLLGETQRDLEDEPFARLHWGIADDEMLTRLIYRLPQRDRTVTEHANMTYDLALEGATIRQTVGRIATLIPLRNAHEDAKAARKAGEDISPELVMMSELYQALWPYAFGDASEQNSREVFAALANEARNEDDMYDTIHDYVKILRETFFKRLTLISLRDYGVHVTKIAAEQV